MIKVSVIVPIYNAEKYLNQCLDSIINQTLKDIEIILINDGSTNGSADICKAYLTDTRVSYYHKENEGLAAARDDGMLRASGEYIGFIDSDDWIEPDMYEKMYAAAKTNDSDIVFCNCVENEDGHRFTPEMPSGPYNRIQILDEILPHSLAYLTDKGDKRSIRWSNCLRIYKKATLDSFGFRFNRAFRRSQDSQLTYEATIHARNFYYLGDYFYHNRVVGDSLSRGYTKNMWPLYIPLIERLYKDTEEFTERNLMPQMHLRNFFFVCECIDNEFKPTCPNDKATRIAKIQEIMDSPICERFYNQLPLDKMNETLRAYYNFTVEKDAKGLYNYVLGEKKKAEFRKKYILPVIHFITEGPVIGVIYKKIRK